MSVVAEIATGGILATSIAAMIGETTILKTSIKEVVPTAIKIGWVALNFAKRKKVVKDLAKTLFQLINKEIPNDINSKSENVEDKKYSTFLDLLSKMLSQFSTEELLQYLEYCKILRKLFYNVSFDDNYWTRNSKQLIQDPEALKNYMIKKMFAENLTQTLLIKVYNSSPNPEEKEMLRQDIITEIMDDRLTTTEVENMCINFEMNLHAEYMENKELYDEEFIREKKCLIEIFDKMKLDKKAFNTTSRKALTRLSVVINDLENDIEDNQNFEKSPELQQTMLVRSNSISGADNDKIKFNVVSQPSKSISSSTDTDSYKNQGLK